jgi:hypothetical protein
MVVATFLSSNRSGWVGALLIAVMLYGKGRRLRSTIFMGFLVFCAYYAVVHYANSAEFDRRMQQTVQGNESDTIRKELIVTALSIGLEHPVFGASPIELPQELARRMPQDAISVGSKNSIKVLDPHNVIVHIIGGCGFLTFAVFICLGWQMWKRPRSGAKIRNALNGASGSHALLRMMLLLWVVRGMFTREILYSPSFSMGLGLTIGLCILHGVWATREEPQYAQHRNYLQTQAARRHSPPPKKHTRWLVEKGSR